MGRPRAENPLKKRQFRCSDEEHRLLHELARRHGVTASALLRDLIRQKGARTPESRGRVSLVSEFKLCYVNKCWAWFTTAELKDQWGDDWNDAPYEYNAGDPYEWSGNRGCAEYKLKKLAFDDANFLCPHAGCGQSGYSVESINRGDTPWLTPLGSGFAIYAGIPLNEFISLIKRSGGSVYMEKT